MQISSPLDVLYISIDTFNLFAFTSLVKSLVLSLGLHSFGPTAIVPGFKQMMTEVDNDHIRGSSSIIEILRPEIQI